MEKRYYLAVDIGASSGRHIVGWMEDGRLCTEEVYRFPNGVQRQDGHLVWDIEGILAQVKAGLKAAFSPSLTWAKMPSMSQTRWPSCRCTPLGKR